MGSVAQIWHTPNRSGRPGLAQVFGRGAETDLEDLAENSPFDQKDVLKLALSVECESGGAPLALYIDVRRWRDQELASQRLKCPQGRTGGGATRDAGETRKSRHADAGRPGKTGLLRAQGRPPAQGFRPTDEKP